MRKTNSAGVNLIKEFESFRSKPYLCSAGIPTIGYGATFYENGVKVTLKDSSISEEKAITLLESHLAQFEKQVENMVKVELNDNEFAALVSFCFNIGSGALQSSTLLKLLNAGTDRVAVADQFLRWDKAGGKQLSGLTRRRQAERSLFLQPVIVESNEQLGSGPSEDDINNKLQTLEDEIMKK